ncbi:ABC transporter ATP-binding protein [Microbacterium sp. NPDC056044]|uniref:ABC transporter ATP-binding protein n=1 Tax=Microbacterium sp. NPDC056044 TaxID=3345690 RepID=UPI0035DBBBE8
MTSTDPILRARGLRVSFSGDDGWVEAVHGIDFEVAPGEIVALVGESGSGKSATAMSILGLLAKNGRRTGDVSIVGEDVSEPKAGQLQRIRGSKVGMIFQEPMTALNPVYTIGRQLEMALGAHRRLDKTAARARALELLNLVHIPEPEMKLDHFPHQLSGGQRQRAMIAMAICNNPELLIADEPTTALDVTVQAGILDLLRELRDTRGMSILIITHDMGVVADIADRVVVMRHGEIIEAAPAADLFADPRMAYTQDLLAAVPRLGSLVLTDRPLTAAIDSLAQPVVQMKDVQVEFSRGFRRAPLQAVDGVDLAIGPKEIVALVGESGSGKSTLGRVAVGLQPAKSGSYLFRGTELIGARRSTLRRSLNDIAMVFQDPGSSLNPRATIGDSIVAPLRYSSQRHSRADMRDRAAELLHQVRLPSEWVDRYPHQLSGGQRQRVGIARAIANRPAFIVADEPTSALDVSVQRTVLDLLLELQESLGFACLFITHDLSVVEMLADRTIVLNKGKVIESGTTANLLHAPRDPYTRTLLASAPVPDPAEQRRRRELRREAVAAL